MESSQKLQQENERLKRFLSMDFRYSLFYIKSASDLLKASESLHPEQKAELLQGISLAVDKSLSILHDRDERIQ